MFAFIFISTTLYNLTHLLLLAIKSNHLPSMLEIPPTPPLPTVPPAQDFSKLGFVYIIVLGLTNQIVPHTGSWCSLATAVNYLVRIALIVYLAFQEQPSSPMRAHPDSGMGHYINSDSTGRLSTPMQLEGKIPL
ncbi:hypothetical protein DSO57_1035058 [Entomophthora muscae]|uniref:Uncharacterized protein n=1 Tax=Entomophthora muscae TaxID=34485 RepID=A0ACC2S1X1_9FUNG|nr:hypothetical protein DSO57_1035058 [Entomophthora muscae]